MSRVRRSSSALRSSASLSPWLLAALVDQNRADSLNVGAGHLQIDERKGCGGRDRNRERESERQAKRPRFEELKNPHSV